jgi:hypothetical protein
MRTRRWCLQLKQLAMWMHHGHQSLAHGGGSLAGACIQGAAWVATWGKIHMFPQIPPPSRSATDQYGMDGHWIKSACSWDRMCTLIAATLCPSKAPPVPS